LVDASKLTENKERMAQIPIIGNLAKLSKPE
jgi:hypothetical protein